MWTPKLKKGMPGPPSPVVSAVLVSLVCTCVMMMTSPADAQTTLVTTPAPTTVNVPANTTEMTNTTQAYYNQSQLQSMVYLFKILKSRLAKRLADLWALHDALQPLIVPAIYEMRTELETQASMYGDLWKIIDPIASRFFMKRVSASKLISRNPYPGNNKVFLTDLREDFSIYPLPWMSRITVYRSGIYMLDLKAQTDEYEGVNVKLEIVDKAGIIRRTLIMWTDWEAAPHHKLVHMEAGDTLRTYSIFASDPSGYNLVYGDTPLLGTTYGYLGTQLSLYFVDYVAGAASVFGTTASPPFGSVGGGPGGGGPQG